MFRDFDPRPGGVDGDDRDTRDDRDVPDPYYGEDDGFEQVLAIVTRTSRALVDRLRGLLLG
jgi:protein-tyrosine phosphatase